MIAFDIFLLIVIGIFILAGFWLGFIHSFGAVLGTILGALIAGHNYEKIATWLEPFFLGHLNLARVVCFLLLFIIITRLVGLIFHIINKIFNIISFFPFVKTFNRLTGALFGLFEGVLIIGIFVYILNKYPTGWAETLLPNSQIAPVLMKISSILTIFLPKFLTKLEGVI